MKRSPFWKTYAALAVAAALGAYLWFVERKRPEPTEEKPKEKVFTFDRSKVQAVTLAPQGGEEIRLVKEKDAWRMTAPTDVAADAQQVDSLLSSLDGLSADGLFGPMGSAVDGIGSAGGKFGSALGSLKDVLS